MKSYYLLIFNLVLALSLPSFAAEKSPKVGRGAAAKYFEAKEESSSSSGDSVLMLHVGQYRNSESYKWKGSDKREDIGKANYGVTYLYDEWNSFDLNFRADFSEYKLDDKSASKLSLMPLIIFPRAETRFPVYFGVGGGLGVFFTQIEEESNLSLDYQLLVGVRLMDLYEGVGAFLEYGMKNHLHVLSDGQFNATALNIGAIFSF